MKRALGLIVALGIVVSGNLFAADKPGRPPVKTNPVFSGKLSIHLDKKTDQVVLSWTGNGVLQQASASGGIFKPVRASRNRTHSIPRNKASGIYRLAIEAGRGRTVYSQNVVGYVNLSLPPGLSLVQNPLRSQHEEVDVATSWPDAPDGSQILKYNAGSGYEVATFDAIAGEWTNPNLKLPLGEGFYFRNTSDTTIYATFVGEVMQGVLVNPLPVGYSMKGALVPIAASLNAHRIPGEIGDQIRTYRNDNGQITEYLSIYSGDAEGWVPDLHLGVGQAFWIYKHRPQDWVYEFSVN